MAAVDLAAWQSWDWMTLGIVAIALLIFLGGAVMMFSGLLSAGK